MSDAPIGDLTASYVLYRTTELDLDWLPDGAPVVLVHNDDRFDRSTVPARLDVTHLDPGRNVGFGAGHDLALDAVRTERLAVLNPDTRFAPEHWRAFASGAPDEIVVVPLHDDADTATSVVNPYPQPLSHLATGWKLGRLAPIGSRRRALLARGGDAFTREHQATLAAGEGDWPITTHWCSGAALSIDADVLRAVGGFDERYFLYFEDVDLCDRLRAVRPDLRIVMPPVAPAVHRVGASATAATARTVALHHARSAARYAHARSGAAWRAVASGIDLRVRLLERSTAGATHDADAPTDRGRP